MTLFSDDVLMLNAAEMEEWYERELIMRAENELRVRSVGGTTSPITPVVNASLIPWVGLVPAQFNILNGQNFTGTAIPGASAWAQTFVTITTGLPAPDGTATASKIVENAVLSNEKKIDIGGFQLSSFGANTQSFDIPMRIQLIAKAAGRTRLVLKGSDGNPGNGDQVSVCVDLAGGQIGFDNQTTNWTIQAATITQPFGIKTPDYAGWWLITLDFTKAGPNNTSFSIDTQILLDNGSGTASRSVIYTGDGSSGVLIWYCVLLPRAAWSFTGESFRDDFTSLSTIDVGDTRRPGYNWYVHNRWPNAAPAAGPFWTTGTTTPAANITLDSPSVVKVIAPDTSPAFAFTSVAADPVTGNPTILGPTFQAPCIVEASFAYDSAPISGFTGKSGSFPSWWSISLGLLQGTFPNACEIDIADQANTVVQDPFNVTSQDAGGTTWVAVGGGFAPTSHSDFRQFAVMFFAPNPSTNNHGFALAFWKQVASTATINSQFMAGCWSLRWTSSSVLASQSFMINVSAGLGTVSYGGPFIPFNIPVFYDWIRIIK